MNSDNIRADYIELNKSYRKGMVYYLTDRGLGSEINILLVAILYCFTKKYRFRLCSTIWNSGYWEDYFVPFCEHIENPNAWEYIKKKRYSGKPSFFQYLQSYREFYIDINRQYSLSSIHNFVQKNLRHVRKCLKFLCFNMDIISWMYNKIFNFYFEYIIFKKNLLKQLNIQGDIFEAKRIMLEMIFVLNEKTKKAVYGSIGDELQLCKNWIGIHVRRGDKVTTGEAENHSISEYVSLARKYYPENMKFFIATDSYDIIDEFRFYYPECSFFTYCHPDLRGHEQAEFNNASADEIQQNMYRLLRDIILLLECKGFIGTYSSNIGRMICLLRNNTDCYSLDSDPFFKGNADYFGADSNWHPF